jgi:hypothetical protein
VTALGYEDTIWILERFETRQRPEGSEPLIVIGGQALNYWCDLYKGFSPELAAHGPFASKDLDFQGERRLVPWCSQQLGGRYTLTGAGDRNTLQNGVVVFTDSRGVEQSVDFMRYPYGLNAKIVAEASAPVIVHGADVTFGIKMMHPLHCMRSRVSNVMGLAEKYATDHGMRQLRASIVCMRLFTEATAREDQKRAQALNEAIFKFALHDNDAQRLLKVHGVDVFDAVSSHESLGDNFCEKRMPQMRREIEKSRA